MVARESLGWPKARDRDLGSDVVIDDVDVQPYLDLVRLYIDEVAEYAKASLLRELNPGNRIWRARLEPGPHHMVNYHERIDDSLA
jgi:hypothetical protein